MARKLGDLVLHPFLFGAYAILAMLATNADQTRPVAGLRALVVVAVGSVVAYLILRLVFRNAHRAGIAASFLVLGMLSYGHLYDALKDGLPVIAPLIRHRYLLPLSAAALLPVAYLVSRIRAPERVTPLLNLVAVVAIVFPLWRLGHAELAYAQVRAPSTEGSQECTLAPADGTPRPDIYLLIMDAYERDDVLREMHGFDNTPFLREMEARGFYIARGSLSNFRTTELSIASLLNLNYIQSMEDVYSAANISHWGIMQKISNNRLRHELECLGYKTVAFETGTFWADWQGTDYFLAPNSGPFASLSMLGGLSHLEAEWLDTTVVRALLDAARESDAARQPAVLDEYADNRERILFAFDELERVPRLPSPKLVVAHILSPHPPMVFGPNGEAISAGEFESTLHGDPSGQALLDAYSDQVSYLNKRLLQTVDSILAQSDTPPIIVIQGDHGWADRNHEDKMSILNAYHLPGAGSEGLYPTITPVNSFRLILNEYLGGDFALLEDVSYFSHETDIYDFEVIENSWVPDRP